MRPHATQSCSIKVHGLCERALPIMHASTLRISLLKLTKGNQQFKKQYKTPSPRRRMTFIRSRRKSHRIQRPVPNLTNILEQLLRRILTNAFKEQIDGFHMGRRLCKAVTRTYNCAVTHNMVSSSNFFANRLITPQGFVKR